jgi:hypothetical protein
MYDVTYKQSYIELCTQLRMGKSFKPSSAGGDQVLGEAKYDKITHK